MTGVFRHRDRYPDSKEPAERILSHLFEIAGGFESAVDVGGGIGSWSAVLKRLGVSRVLCIDDPSIKTEELLVEADEFLPCDMNRKFPAPVVSDLAICLEVAEHLAQNRSDALVDFLTASADFILFSAAIPGQPSMFHVNEQPAEFWRTRFERRGFRRFDCIRPRIVYDAQLPYWYRQNMFVFAPASEAAKRRLQSLPFSAIPTDFELVHTRVLEQYRTPRHPKLRDVPSIVERSLRARFRGL